MNQSHCGIVACDVNSHSSASASFQFAPEIEDRFDSNIKRKCTKRHRCITILVGLFTTAIILCVAASLALILTQKPVNFDEIEGFTYGDATNSKFRGSQRRYPDKQYISHSYSDILSNQPRLPISSIWLPDDSFLIRQGRDYYRVDPNKADTIRNRDLYISGKNLPESSEFIFNSNGKYAAILRAHEKVFRHSSKFLCNVGEYHRGSFINQQPVGLTNNEKLQLFSWNPANDATDFVYVSNNNIYYQSDPFNPESAKQVTFTGSESLYFGVPDWVYEEEIFSTDKALWWSQSGDYLAFTMIDDSNVTKIEVPYYYETSSLPAYREIPYPKTGTKDQPSVTLFIWSKEQNVTHMVLPQELIEMGASNSYYLFRAGWISLENDAGEYNDYLISVFANRDQNTVYIMSCQFGVGCSMLQSIKFSMNGMEMWADPELFTIKYYSKTGFFILLPHEHSDGNVYNHVAHVSVTKEGKYYPVSGYHGGAYDINSIVGYDKNKDELFIEAEGGIIGEQHLFRIPYASVEDNVAPQCVTCLIPDCKLSDSMFSPTSQNMIIHCSAPFKNTVSYLKKSNNIVEHYVIYDHFSNNTEFKPNYSIPSLKIETLMLSSGYEANILLVLPPNFNSKNTYPVLLDVYAGPGTNKVHYSTPDAHFTYFSSVRDYVIVSIDGRGSGNKGWKFREPMYKNFGGPEIIDQIDGLRLLLKKYPFMDPERVAALGWSYGGFVTGHIAARDAGHTVKCAISVAPVVDFKYYDSAYTERYMLLPDENTSGYNANSLLNRTKILNFQHVNYLLAHGEADDNVHYQNSALLAMELQKHDIHFTQLVYPNQDHSIYATRPHLINEFDLFLRNCYNLNYLRKK